MSNYKRYFENSNFPIFITFVTHNRRNILIQNINILRNSFQYAKTKFKFDIVAICVMKNHCHLLMYANDVKDIPKIIRTIKFNFSLNVPEIYIDKNLSASAIKRGEKGIWQRRYYDHIIRNENDFWKHLDYIHYNSLKHYDTAPKDWEYSSFKKFVTNNYYDINWCNNKDTHNIKELDFE